MPFSTFGVEVVLCQTGSIKDAIGKYQEGLLESVNGANVRDQYGMVGKLARDRMKVLKKTDEGEKDGKKDIERS